MVLDPDNEPMHLDGPAFTNRVETIINYKGNNFYMACGTLVTGVPDEGTTTCVKRIGHPGDIHEDWDGNQVEGVREVEKPEKIFDWTTSTPIEEAVGQAIGAASACWENLSGAGIFESTRAKQIVDELVAYINSKQPIY